MYLFDGKVFCHERTTPNGMTLLCNMDGYLLENRWQELQSHVEFQSYTEDVSYSPSLLFLFGSASHVPQLNGNLFSLRTYIEARYAKKCAISAVLKGRK